MEDKEKERIVNCVQIQKKVIDAIADCDKHEAYYAIATLVIAGYMGTKEQFLDFVDRGWDAVIEEWNK